MSLPNPVGQPEAPDDAAPESGPLSSLTGTHARIAAALVILVSIAALWIMRADHPLWPPDEGRYGSVSMHVAQGEGWIVPQIDGRPHLTKPPLTYWAQATCLRLLGHRELAVRMPSLAASSLTILLLLYAGWRIGGPMVGVIAAALMAVMPMHIGINWLAITDPMLSLFWFATLVGGFFAVQDNSGRWRAVMWTAVALAMMVKGPLALVPVGVLLIWLLISRRRKMVWRLGIPIGLPASLLPIAVWVAAVIRTCPEAIDIWLHETVGRSVGQGDHPEPLWYYLPIFLVGLFPATGMMTIPGWNLSIPATWRRLRDGDPMCLWALAVVLPLLMFTFIAGKLPTYLLPTAPPMALATAFMLKGWLTGRADRPPDGTRPPDVAMTLMVCTLLMALAGLVAVFSVDLASPWLTAPLLLLPAAHIWMWWNWKRNPHRRAAVMIAAWAAGMSCWCCGLAFEQLLFDRHSARTMLSDLPALSGIAEPRLAEYGFDNPVLSFYSRRDVHQLSRADLLGGLANQDGSLILLASADDWDVFVNKHPERAVEFEHLGDWPRWPDRLTRILKPPVESPSDRTD